MKVIDLLNKIANGNDVPNQIIYNGNYYYNVGNKEQAYYENAELEDNLFLCAVYNEGHLNDDVEIIEDTPKEDKKITKLNEHIFVDAHSIVLKINEIIDKINGDSNE